MIDGVLVKKKIDSMQRDLEELKAFEHLTVDQIMKDYRTHKVVERILEVIIDDAIDINQHLIINSPKKQLPFDFKESFLILSELGIYPSTFAQSVSQSVGLRNILVHQYRELDEQLFYQSIRDCLREYPVYCAYILAYLKKQEA